MLIAMDMLTLIEDRRDRREHSAEDLEFLAQAAAHNTVPDYQLAAWLMAAYLNPLTETETANLTIAMARSGERIDLQGLPKPWVDKHSTGGVGDKTSLVVLPILASCGLTVVKMSGRGLGITGGTVDKLESIPGFRMDLTPDEMKDQADLIGIAVTGQSPNLAPADKTLYALRDTTGTTENIPLIASSVLSKKIAGGCEYLSLDVKAGSGAFMKAFEKADELAQWLKRIGEQCGLKVHAAITDMEQPLGSAVGNILEVKEALKVLRNQLLTPPVERFKQLCIELCGETLHFVGKASTREEGISQAQNAMASGRADAKCREWFAAQGAQRESIDDPFGTLPDASVTLDVLVHNAGFISRIDAGIVGETVVSLGGGRKKKEDRINPTVGVMVHKMVGDEVDAGDSVLTIHAATQPAAQTAADAIAHAIEISEAKVDPRPIVIKKI